MVHKFLPGVSVRLIDDPGRSGILTNGQRIRLGEQMYNVKFSDNSNQWLPEKALEIITDRVDDVFDMLAKKQFGKLKDYRRSLTYIQLTGRLANLVYSMDTTNTEFYAYQYKPLISFLDSPSKGLLIADEVGLGKTIEAGLIWTELRARYDARKLLIVCPAMLREKWKLELIERFGVDATIMSADDLLKWSMSGNHLEKPGKAIICSYDSLRPPKNFLEDSDSQLNSAGKIARIFTERAEQAETPLFDLVVFDEAHKMRNPESATSKLGRLLRDACEHLILLSATPINTNSEDLYYLLNIADEDTFSNIHIFPEILRANEPLIQAQKVVLNRESHWKDVCEYLIAAKQRDLLRNNEQLSALLNLTTKEANRRLANDAGRIHIANLIEKCNLLSKVVTRTRKADVKELRVVREPYAPTIQMTEAESELYYDVTEAVRDYACLKDVNDGFLLAQPQRQLSSSMPAAIRAWRNKSFDRQNEQVYEDFGSDDDTPKNTASLMQWIATNVLPNVDLEILTQFDSKFNALQQWMTEWQRDYPNEKLIIFSYFRETLKYLLERLSAIGIGCKILVGGMRENKQEIINSFKSDNFVKVLLASEVASEGVDLQFCRILINYDLPWNPMRVEQRIGRIDRHGQQANKISIINFCYHGTIDQRIYERLYERLGIFQYALGDMEEILGKKISNLTTSLFTEKLTPEQEQRQIEQTALAIERLRQHENELEAQASNLIAHGGHILERVKAAHDFGNRISDKDLSLFVMDYLERFAPGHVFRQLIQDEERYKIQLPPKTRTSLREFIARQKLQGITRLAEGHAMECLFKNTMVVNQYNLEVINQTHPLVRFISEELDKSLDRQVALVAIEAEVSSKIKLPKGTYVLVLKKASIQGIRTEETMLARAVNLITKHIVEQDLALEFANQLRLFARDWHDANINLDASIVEMAIDELDLMLEEDFKTLKQLQNAENNDRINLQISSVQRHFERRENLINRAIEANKMANKTKILKLNEGKLRKNIERKEQRLAELEAKRDFNATLHDVCCLVVKLNPKSRKDER